MSRCHFSTESAMRRWIIPIIVVVALASIWFAYTWYYVDGAVAATKLYNNFGHWALRRFGDLLERQSKKLAGSDAVDCGRLWLGVAFFWPESSARNRRQAVAASQCAIQAFNSGKSFRVRYQIQGVDSDGAIGFASPGRGLVYTLLFDGDPLGQGGTNFFRQRVRTYSCPSPLALKIFDTGMLTCFPGRQNAPGDIMWPH
jgi:hypothetical protein